MNLETKTGAVTLRGRRNVPVDLAKTIAIFGVLLIHSFAVGGYHGTLGSAAWNLGLLWGTVLRCAVPVFFLCSGALLLPPEKEIPVRRVWGKYILRIFTALMFWAAAYAGWDLLLRWHRTSVLEKSALREALRNWALFHHPAHLYYLHIILLLYALAPLTRILTAHATRRQLQYFLAAWLVLGILLPAVQNLPPFAQITGIPRQYPLNLTYSSLGYTVAGYYLSRYAHRPRVWGLLYLAGLALTYFGTLTLSLKTGKLWQPLLYGNAPGVCAQALGVFGFCASRFRDARPCRRAEIISKASFCIYLCHMFFLNFFRDHGFTAASFCPAVSVPLIAVILFACGFAVYLVLRKIPWVNRWLI
jgi:surface polysaccharide O-acyltransferase-like enzyme